MEINNNRCIIKTGLIKSILRWHKKSIKDLGFASVDLKISKLEPTKFMSTYLEKLSTDLEKFDLRDLHDMHKNKNILVLFKTSQNEEFIRELVVEKEEFSLFYQLVKIQTPPKKNPVISEFDEVTKYLPNKTELLNKKMPLNYDLQVLDLLEKKNWQGFSDHNMDDFLCQMLQLFSQKRISRAQFTTSTFYWSLRQKYKAEEIRIVSLFENGEVNKEAKEAMMKTLSPLLKFENSKTTQEYKEEHLDKMFEKMKEAPASEQVFFAIEEKSLLRTSLEGEQTITQAIQAVGINLFMTFEENPMINSKRMIVSLSIMQMFLYACAEECAVEIFPRIRESSMEDIENNGKEGTRDMGIPFIGAPLPKTADKLIVPNDWDFWMHDFYHAVVVSLARQASREAFIKIAKNIQDIKKDFSNDEELCEVLQRISNLLVDMELGAYRYRDNNPKKTHEYCFVSQLNGLLNTILHSLDVDKTKMNISEEQISQERILLEEKICKKRLMFHVAKACLKDHEFMFSDEIQLALEIVGQEVCDQVCDEEFWKKIFQNSFHLPYDNNLIVNLTYVLKEAL